VSALHVVHAVLSLDVGGLEKIVISLVRVGRQQGQKVTVICVEKPGKLAAEAEAEGATVITLDKLPGRSPEHIQRAAKVLIDVKADVIHSHQIGAAWYVGQAARYLGNLPILHTEHGNQFSRSISWWATLKTRIFFHQAARFIDRFCCVSQEIADTVVRWMTVPKHKVEVIPNGIRSEASEGLRSPEQVRFALGIPKGSPVVGSVGRLNEVKCQHLLIRAIARVRETVPDVRVLLVGDGEERARLETLANELGLRDRTHFAGYQSQPDEFLGIMSVFALTSRSEGFPVSLLEAWRAGVPAICSSVGGIPRILTNERDGLLFPPNDVEALASCLVRILGDRDLGSRLADNGLHLVRERYSLERIGAEYEVRYKNLVAALKRGAR
jgi:glycosyltransferase involved in cell wall biosynthesis